MGIDSTVDSIDMNPHTDIGGVVGLTEIGGEPAIRDIGILGKALLNCHSKHTADIGRMNSMAEFVLHGEIVVESMPERIAGMSVIEHHDGVASLYLEVLGNSSVFNSGCINPASYRTQSINNKS